MSTFGFLDIFPDYLISIIKYIHWETICDENNQSLCVDYSTQALILFKKFLFLEHQ